MPTKSYNRLTGQLGYSNTYFKKTNPLSVNAKISYFSTFDDEKNDPDMLKREIYQSKEQSFGFKLFGSWLVKKPWLTNITYNFAGDFKNEDYYEYKVAGGSGATPLPTATVSGESVGTLLPSSYDSKLNIEGKPYSYFATVKGNVTGKFGKVYSNLMYGVEWRTTETMEQAVFMTLPGHRASHHYQAKIIQDIPANRNLALFLEEKVNFCPWLYPIENAGRIEVQQHASYRTIFHQRL